MDSSTTIQSLKDFIKKFMEERDWGQFHSPKNLSMQISVEASELMELFLWVDTNKSGEILEKKREAVEQEVADIAICLINFCIRTDIDLSEVIKDKMILNGEKYPVEKAKGKSNKYNEL